MGTSQVSFQKRKEVKGCLETSNSTKALVYAVRYYNKWLEATTRSCIFGYFQYSVNPKPEKGLGARVMGQGENCPLLFFRQRI